ncbi:hypothetical protein GCM10027300_35700 [Modestobacter lapidis]
MGVLIAAALQGLDDDASVRAPACADVGRAAVAPRYRYNTATLAGRTAATCRPPAPLSRFVR